MTTLYYILTFAAGMALTRILSYYFTKPTNQYNGKLKITQKGRNNELSVDVKAYINSTKPRQFRKDKRELKK